MFFKKKSDKEKLRCFNCESKITENFSFCPYCGESLVNLEEEMHQFGLLGRNDLVNEEFSMPPQLGMMEKMVTSLMKTMMKNIDQQTREAVEKSEVTAYPNGIKIKIGMPMHTAPQTTTQPQTPATKTVTDEQIKKMSGLPRIKAKMSMRRLSNKIIYELNTPGITSTDDVLLAKLESGYEVKAISDKKVYVNSIPVNLPLQGFSLQDNKLIVEFKAQR
ncbi:MAG: hypothetical protein AABY00_02140 [Nanoarchaeota archaeon]